MFIPNWALLILGVIIWVIFMIKASEPKGDYDFISPLIGIIIFIAGIAFFIGLLL